MEYALTINPLSTGYRRRFEDAAGARPTYVDYVELRQLSARALFRKLRQLRASSLLLPVEDESSRCILPLMKGLAVMSGASAIRTVGPDLRIERVTRWTAGRSLMEMLAASAVATRDMAACDAELKSLLRLPRQAKEARGNSVLYIKGNLLFGLKAGGSIGHVTGVVNAFSQSGYDVTLASTEPFNMILPSVRKVALEVPNVFGLPFEKSNYSLHRMMVNQLAGETETRPAFIYQRMSAANYAGVSLSRRWNVPLVLEYNGSEVWVSKNWGRSFRYPEIASAAEDVCLRHADLIVTVSEVLADELVQRGVPRERIVWYPNCVDPTVFDPARFSEADGHALRARLNIPAGAPLITFIGTFGPWHGVEVFAQAIRDLVDHHRAWLEASGTRFLLVGDGPKMPAVRQALSDAPYSSFVTLTGLVPQADAAQYLATTDVVVSPHVDNRDGSRFFGSPTKLFEYMAMGKAIVASELEQIGTILKDGLRVEQLPAGDTPCNERRPAVLCPPGDVDALGRALRFVVDKPGWRKALGRHARSEALAKYTWPHHVSAILDGLASISTGSQNE